MSEQINPKAIEILVQELGDTPSEGPRPADFLYDPGLDSSSVEVERIAEIIAKPGETVLAVMDVGVDVGRPKDLRICGYGSDPSLGLIEPYVFSEMLDEAISQWLKYSKDRSLGRNVGPERVVATAAADDDGKFSDLLEQTAGDDRRVSVKPRLFGPYVDYLMNLA